MKKSVTTSGKTKQELIAENEELRLRLEEAEETLDAIRSGEVDALLVSGPRGDQVYTLQGADRTYRELLESINEGAATLAVDGTILYCNSCFAGLLKLPLEQLIGATLNDFVPASVQRSFEALLQSSGKREIVFKANDGTMVPVYLSISMLRTAAGQASVCITATDLSEQKRNEEILSQGHLLNLIFDKTAEPIIVCNEQGVIMKASNAAYSLCDRNILLQHFDAVLPLTLTDGQPFSIAAILGMSVLPDIEVSITREDGRVFNLIINAAQLQGENGKTIGCVMTLTDITSHKEAEEAMRKAHDELEGRVLERTTELKKTAETLKYERQRFADVLDDLPAYVILLTPDYKVSFANRFFRERFGEDCGRRCFDYLFGRSEPCEVCETYKVLKTMEPHTWKWTGPDRRNYDVFDFPFVDADGSPLILEMGIDVSEQRRLEESLREASNYARSLIEASLDPLVTISPEGKITDVNRATEQVTGVARAQLIGNDFSGYFTESDKARAGYQKVLAEDYVRDYPLTLRHVSGRTTDVLYNAAVYRNDAGQVQGVFAAARDITERKKAETELEKYRNHLEDLVVQRTSQLEAANANLQVEIAERVQLEIKLKESHAEAINTMNRLEAVFEALPVGVAIIDAHGGNRKSNSMFETIWAGPRPVTQTVSDYVMYKAWWFDTGMPVQPEQWASARAVHNREPVIGQIMRIQRFNGSQAIVMNSAVPIEDSHGKPAGCAVVIMDITAIKYTEQRLNLLADTAGRLLRSESPQTIVESLCRSVMDFLDCQIFFNFLADDEKGRLHLNACSGIPEEEKRKIEWLEYGNALCGCAARDGMRIVAEDILNTPDIRTELVMSCGITAYACHPLMSGDKVIGTLSFGTRTRTRFTEDELSLMKAVADQVAIAIARKQIEDALRQSEERLRLAQASAHVGIWDWNPQTDETAFTPELEQLFGLTSETSKKYQDFLRLIHPDDIPKIKTAQREGITDKKPFDFEFRIIRPSGELCWLSTKAGALYNEEGEATRVFGVAMDITERKLIEEAQLFLLQCGRREGENFFEALAVFLARHLGMDYVCIDRLMGDSLSAQTLAVYSDGKFEDNIEYTLKDTPWGDVVEKTVCTFPKEVCRLFPRDTVLQEMKAESYVGTTLWSTTGEPIGLIAVIGRKPLPDTRLVETILKLVSVRAAGELESVQHEQSLREYLERLDSLIKVSVEVISATSISVLSQRVADAARELTGAGIAIAGHGYKDEFLRVEAVSKDNALPALSLKDMFRVDKGGVYLDMIGRGISVCYTDEELRSRPEWWGLPEGHTPLRGLCGAPLTGVDNKAKGLIMVSDKDGGEFTELDQSILGQLAVLASIAMQHIEARNNVELQASALAAANTNLLEENKKRKLVEQVLTQYMENLRHSNEELDNFASIVSHDLQEPLRSIAGFLRLLEKKYGESLDERGQEFIARSLKNSRRLEAMINNLLAYSRITTRGGDFVEHALEDDLQDALENLENTLVMTGAVVTHETLPCVYGDPHQVVRVFQNLIGNSIKYHGTEPPVIHVAVKPQGDEFIISVRDNGMGIDPEYQRDIFNLFTRYPSGDKSSGTGIGLAVCKKIIERHKGRIWITSELGKGSTVYFSIPAGGGVNNEQ